MTMSVESIGKNPRLRCFLNVTYADAIYAAGGIPVPIPTPAAIQTNLSPGERLAAAAPGSL
jgi:hypothetical protein